ncbi:hypothetical protein HNQ80_004015 [Anaerosolibacter carboniphilus]|uniref:Uncharacterized protein n=1 Tax=Anaerosolibacter carboniphilus TaxID=1417629 RepID=A0A841L663_9FIRM|nr:hypothetical protein [Anaerosolibacter carboniphilus]MBB6217879.1 hypothetical protein [Anaerosolibacter carboniphilus]
MVRTRIIRYLLFICMSMWLMGCIEKVDKEVIHFKQLENVYGFVNESGKKIITIPSEQGTELENPQEFNIAVGNNGEIIEIEFVKKQEANDKDNWRQTIYNFDNMEGYIYEVKDGEAIKNKTYFLAKDAIINQDTLFELKSTQNNDLQNSLYKNVDVETIKNIEIIKNRKIVDSKLLSKTADNGKVCLFVFERIGEDMLASIAYIEGDQVIFKDYPAKYDKLSTWRVDAGDEPGLFEVLFLANSDEGLLLGLTWAGPEGENAFVLKEENGVLQQTDLKSSRYWAP